MLKMVPKKIISLLLSIATLLLFNQTFCLIQNNVTNNDFNNKETTISESYSEPYKENKIIKKIIISGNNLISSEAILSKSPYKVGQKFNPLLTSQFINNLYNLKYFDDIEIMTEDISPSELNLYIIVKELKKIETVKYEGNTNLKPDEIEKKIKISEIPAINEEGAQMLAEQIKKLYQEKNFHDAKVVVKLEPTAFNNVNLVFKINEGKKALVKKVIFIGNKAIKSKKLRSIIFTREDWILGAIDKSGTFHPAAIDSDKYIIEDFYQSRGYLAAQVTDVTVDIDKETQYITVTFHIDEGDLYTIKNVRATPNHLLTESQILAAIPIKPGQLYNRELIRLTIDMLRNTWGRFGYIYSEIEPIVKPDFENKTVDITFDSDLGSQVFLNRINIIGNYKTRDYVIRRNILLTEGDLITTQLMELSKNRIESLGFFDPREGVNWKINRISQEWADLDLYVQEIRTGRISGQVGFGGADIKSPSSSLRIMANISDRNFMGTAVRYNLTLAFSKEDRSLLFNIFQPWIFDYPIGAGLDFFVRRTIYEDFKNVTNPPTENVTGIIGQLSFAPQRFPDLATIVNAGFEHIRYDNPVKVSGTGKTDDEKRLFQMLIDRRFEPGKLTWVGFLTGQDLRNHPVFPSRGYNWNLSGKFGFPVSNSNFGFFKIDLDATWITPIIGEYDLIFLLHGHLGFAKSLGNNRTVPYRELYHIGGPATVRGFTFGQIGPQLFGDSIGAQKAFWVNAELIFSVTKDRSIRTVLFYDGGAGWDTPNAAAFSKLPLINNRFKFRHAVGFGIRLTQPTPLNIYWGFKLDRNKKLNESISEVHFGMAQEF